MPKDERDDYAPDVIRYWLTGGHWRLLQSATQGTGAGLDPLSSGGKGDRMTLCTIKADLEQAVDRLPLHWRATALLHKRQGRWTAYLARCAAAGPRGGETEYLDHDDALEECYERMARSLGWVPEWERERQAA